MATLSEIHRIRWGDLSDDLRQRARAQVLITAEYLLATDTASPSSTSRLWADRVMRSEGAATEAAMGYLVANGDVQAAAVAEGGTADNLTDQVIASIIEIKRPLIMSQS
jgi:hypothetical protein